MKRVFLTFVCVALSLSISAPLLRAQETPSEGAALEAYRQGAFSRAVQLYTSALSETEDPTHRARLHISIAWTLFALGREGEVNTHLRAALVEDPNHALMSGYYTQEFVDLFSQARQSMAAGGGTAANLPSPDLEITLHSVIERLESGNDLEGALADVDSLLESYPMDGRLVPLKAEILHNMGRAAEAEDIMHGVSSGYRTSLAGSSVPDLIMRANRELDDGDPEAGLEMLRRAVSRQPTNLAALELMAEAAQLSSRWQEAEFALKSALGLQPDNIGLTLRLGEVYIGRGDTSAARDVFRQITEHSPHSDRAWAALGLLDARLGNDPRAKRALAQALAENPLLPEVQLAYGELLLREGKAAEALESLRLAANLLQDDPQVEARIGQALLALGNAREAVVHLRAAVQDDFRPFDVKRSLAMALSAEGSFAECERVLESTGLDQRRESDIIRAVVLLEQAKLVESEKLLRDIISVRLNDPKVLNLLGVSLYRQRRFADSLTILVQAHALAPEDQLIARNHQRALAAKAAISLTEEAKTTRNRLTS